MAALAEQSDVEASLLRALTENEETYIDTLLARASRTVRSYTGQYLEEVTDDEVVVRRDLYGNLRLPQIPVTDVASVVVGGVTLATSAYEWDVHGNITCPFSDGFELDVLPGWEEATVTYTHGYETIPDDIVEIVADLVAGKLSGSSTGGAVKAAQVDDVRVEYDTTTTTSGTDGLTDDQKVVLDRYRQPGRPINQVARRV